MRLFFAFFLCGLLVGCGGTSTTTGIVEDEQPRIKVEDRSVITSDGMYNGPTVTVNEKADGSWLLTYYKGDSHAIHTAVVSRVSMDQGRTWSEEALHTPVYDTDFGVYVRRTPLGNLSSDADRLPDQPAYNRSTDDGASWSAYTSFNTATGSSFSNLAFIDGDRMYMTNYRYAAELGDGTSAFFWVSLDDAGSWNEIGAIRAIGEPGISETAVCKLPSGRIFALSRDSGTNTSTYVHFSDDMGATWEGVIDYTDQVGVIQLPQVLVVGSKVVLFGRDFERRQLVAFISDDNGVTFKDRTVLDTYAGKVADGGYCWPMLMHDGRIFVAYYAAADDLGTPEIRSVKVRVL
jgi:hypothetical protein